MIWYEGDQNIVLSEFNGINWSKPDTIISGNQLFKNWADQPQIYYLGGDTLVVSWLEMMDRGTYDYGIFVAVSSDRGHHWSEPVRPHRDSGKGEHGFISFFKKASGKLGMTWLDGRYMGEYNQITHTMGDMILMTSSLSGNLELDPEHILDNRVCECCPTDAIEIKDGFLIAYRDRSNEEIRNINLIRFSEGKWSDPYPVFDDGWSIHGCPVNGPALSANGNQVAIAWFTAPNNNPIVKAAFSKDGGQSFGNPIRIDSSSAIGRTDMIWLNDRTVLVSWLKEGDETGELILQSIDTHNLKILNKMSFTINSGRGSGYPKLAVAGNYIIIVWTDPEEDIGIRSEWISLKKLL
ncbi:MAG: sialidase family protein [Fidelibacterota bacterium]